MSKTRYLQRIGHSWYVRVKVPRTLQGRVGNTHVRLALGTRDLEEADRRKWPVVAEIQGRLDALRASEVSCWVTPKAVVGQASGDRLEPFARGLDGARSAPLPQQETASVAPRVRTSAETLDVLVDRWLEQSDYIKQTKQQHREAYSMLRRFMGRDVQPSEVDGGVAVAFVDAYIKKSNWSYATKRRKLNSLVALWAWLGESMHVAKGVNPWTGFRLGGKRAAQNPTRRKRPYTEAELVQLLGGQPQYPGLPDVVALGLLTGMRMEEICSLRAADVEWDPRRKCWWINIRKAKTRAGVRRIVVVHQCACALLEARAALAETKDAQLFPEFRGGGYDGKLSWAVSKAFGRFRTRQGLSAETDFHSFRRTFITLLENAGADQVRIARYVGHELPTLAFAVYSGGSSAETMLATASAVKYPSVVESALRTFLAGGANVGVADFREHL